MPSGTGPSILRLLLGDCGRSDGCRLVDWDVVAERAAAHPKEAAARVHLCDAWQSPLSLSLMRDDAPEGVVRALIDAYPAALHDCDSFQGPAALMAALNNESVGEEVFRCVLDANPAAAKQSNWHQNELPLHKAARWGVDVDRVRMLIEAFPKGLSALNKQGWLPLHWACATRKSNPNAVRLLLGEGRRRRVGLGGKSGGGGIFLKNRESKTPLDLAFILFGSRTKENERERWGVVVHALQAAGAAGTSLDDLSSYPVVHAAIEFAPLAVVQRAVEVFPETLIDTDPFGRTALIVAIKAAGKCWRRSRELYRLLLKPPNGNAAAARTKDDEGRLPLHHAVERGMAPGEGLGDIVEVHPDAIARVDPVTGLLPFMLAATAPEVSLDAVFYMLRESPGLVQGGLVPPSIPEMCVMQQPAREKRHREKQALGGTQAKTKITKIEGEFARAKNRQTD